MSFIDPELWDVVKTVVIVPATVIIGWAWKLNKEEHDAMKLEHKQLRESTSSGHSVLNDRIMEHIDDKVDSIRADYERRLDRTNDHITKLFQNAEADRASFREALTDLSNSSTNRHLEILKSQQDILVALHTGLAGKQDK
jgi:hypothetical protein